MKENCFLRFLKELGVKKIFQQSFVYEEFILLAPSPSQMKAATEHLRYWPYVKSFYPIDDKRMKVIIYIGELVKTDSLEHYVVQSLQLMNQCIKQYDCAFTYKKRSRASFRMEYRPDAFLRPDNMLKPFSHFIDDVRK